MKIRLKHQVLARQLVQKNISQNRWAEVLGLDKGHLSQLVNGKRPYPAARTRKKLLEGLELDFDELFEVELPGEEPAGLADHQSPGRSRAGLATERVDLEKERFPMSGLLGAARGSFRVFRAAPGFAVSVILVLALTIGANGALFGILDAVVLRPLPYQNPDRLFLVYQTDRHRGTLREGFSVPDLLDLRERSRTFRQTSGVRFSNMTLTGQGEPARLSTAMVTENHFDVLGVSPILGRTFKPGDAEGGQNRLVLLSESIWQERFGGATSALSQELILDGVSYEIIGVMPGRADFADLGSQIWVPFELDPEQWVRGMHVLTTFCRLPSGVTVDQAQLELDAIMAGLEKDFPEDNASRGGWLAPAHDEVVRQIEDALWLLVAAVACVLLIASVNLANLFLTRFNLKRPELALRSALGAERWRLAGKILGEGLALTLVGLLLGLVLTWAGIRILLQFAPAGVPRIGQVGINFPVVLLTIGAALLSWLVVSLIPALRLSRAPVANLLREDRRQAGRSGQGWVRNAFVIAQVSLALVLLVAGGLLLRSFWEMTRVDPGLETENVLSMNFLLPDSRYPAPENWPFLRWPAVTQLQDELLESVGSIPGVRAAALGISNPLSSGWTTRVAIEGQAEQAQDQREEAYFLPVSEDYFQTLGIPLEKGRRFRPMDDAGHPLVAIVNQAFVDFYFPNGEEPVGERVRVYSNYREIVGVVGDVRFRGLTSNSYPGVYLPARQNPINSLTLVVQTAQPPRQMLAQIRERAREADRDLAFYGVTTLEEFLDQSLGQARFTLFVLTLFSLSAILLAVLGIYAVVSFLVAERTREIGIRMALGADARSVLGLVVGRGMLAVAVGILIGVPAALLASRFLQSQLFGVAAFDPVTLIAVPVLLTLIGGLACYLPARWASRMDPTEALRCE